MKDFWLSKRKLADLKSIRMSVRWSITDYKWLYNKELISFFNSILIHYESYIVSFANINITPKLLPFRSFYYLDLGVLWISINLIICVVHWYFLWELSLHVIEYLNRKCDDHLSNVKTMNQEPLHKWVDAKVIMFHSKHLFTHLI